MITTKSSTLTNLGEAELRKMIARNSRSISSVTKGHLSPVAGEERIWTIARTPECEDVLEMESFLRNSDDARRMTLNSHTANKSVRFDRKRNKVRATASHIEKTKMRKKDGAVKANLDKHRIYCFMYGYSKVLFKSYEEAIRFIKYENAHRRVYTSQLFAYYCESCYGWHISSLPKYKQQPAC